MRQKIIAGNWKMNLDLDQGKELLIKIIDSDLNSNCVTIVAPPYIHLNSFKRLLSHTKIALAAQNCHQQDSGAYTVEISVCQPLNGGAYENRTRLTNVQHLRPPR